MRSKYNRCLEFLDDINLLYHKEIKESEVGKTIEELIENIKALGYDVKFNEKSNSYEI